MSDNKPCIPPREELIKTLGSCVDSVFEMMVSSFEDNTLKRIDEYQDSHDGKPMIEGLDEAALNELNQKRVVLDITGDATGYMTLHCSPEGAASIARGLLMMEADERLELEDVCDALGECANMLAGALKSQALDPIGDFHLSTPRFDCDSRHDEDPLVYQVSKGLMSLEIRFKE